MVGCSDGIIESCRFIGLDGFSQDSGVQAKGGSRDVTVKNSLFRNAGQRAVNIGGSTGLQFFRPEPAGFEARNITVSGNVFVGSLAPIAFVTSTDCTVSRNTIFLPDKWILRILQEQPLDKFMPCQKGVFENNIVVYDARVRIAANVGVNTKPESFVFRDNAWFDMTGRPKLPLPSDELNSVFQIDPQFADPDKNDFSILSKDKRLQDVSAHSATP
ncbi:MAG: right-handed parallel beta-helix repeat-containing protein [Victivallales bacterium]|nr:right-handed parallel beta-helix repeat-containing protein [Victivallales bacterium]